MPFGMFLLIPRMHSHADHYEGIAFRLVEIGYCPRQRSLFFNLALEMVSLFNIPFYRKCAKLNADFVCSACHCRFH
jgi:hypothetical protein